MHRPCEDRAERGVHALPGSRLPQLQFSVKTRARPGFSRCSSVFTPRGVFASPPWLLGTELSLHHRGLWLPVLPSHPTTEVFSMNHGKARKRNAVPQGHLPTGDIRTHAGRAEPVPTLATGKHKLRPRDSSTHLSERLKQKPR